MRAPLIAAKSASGFTGQAVNVSDFSSLALVFQGNGTMSSGTVIFEEADWKDGDEPYSGTWSVVATYTAGTDFHTNAQDIVHAPMGGNGLAWHFVRARIGTAISSGTVTVTLLGSPK